MKRFNIKSLLFIATFLLASSAKLYSAGGESEPLKVDWSFKGITGKFDRASLQRGFQVYKEVCSSCHSMQYLSYRNLGEPGGPEFSEQEVKAIAASVEITDGPDDQGEMFTRPGRPADKFKNPYPNVKASIAANGGAPPFAAIEAFTFGYGFLNLSAGLPGLVNISPWSSGPSVISTLAAIAFTSCSENSGPPGSPRFL